MSQQVAWTKLIVEEFIEQACLSKDEEFVLRTRACGWSRTAQAEYLQISMSTLDKMINRLKKKYDIVQKYDPLLPPRKHSAQETWMDEN